MDHPHRKRCKRYDIEGEAHSLTFSCFQRLPLFSKSRTCQWMLDALQTGRRRHWYDLWAYVVMPEHVHVVLYPQAGIKISSILSLLKQSVSKRALGWLRIHATTFLARLADPTADNAAIYRFWQRGGGYDRNLRSLPDIYQKIEYVHNNPVRRGLVVRAVDWHWSSALAWETGENWPIAIDRESLPPWVI